MKYIQKFILKTKILNLANLMLVILVSLVVWNSVDYSRLQTNTLTQKEQISLDIRILESQKDPFNRLAYNAWSENGLLLVYSPKIMEIGREYTVLGKRKLYNLNEQKNVYKLSLGIVGEINLKQVQVINLNCDWLCSLLKNTSEFKREIQNRFLQAYCGENKSVVNFLLSTGNCRDIFALSVGLVLGGSQFFSDQLKSDFKTLGLTHLVAVSGFQVILLISCLEFLLLRLSVRRSFRFGLSVLAIILMIILVGPQPPVLRSSISVLTSLTVLLVLGRKISSFRSLVYSLVLMLIFNPLYIYSISFQLSGLATLGLNLAPKVEILLPKYLRELLNGFLLTCSTFLFTLPIIVNLSGFVSPFAILANILILPFTTLATVLNIFGLIPILGNLFFVAASLLQSLLIFLIRDLAQFAPKLGLESFGYLEMLGYYLVLIFLLTRKKFST